MPNHITRGEVEEVPDITIVVADEISPLPDDPLDRILDEIRKPRYAFERSFDGQRFTRKIR